MSAPATHKPKLIIHEIWKRKSDRDEETPADLKHGWNYWKKTLHELPFIEILWWCGVLSSFQENQHLSCMFLQTKKSAVAYLTFKTHNEFSQSL